MNWESTLLNACTRLDSVVGVLNVKSYNYGTLPTQVPIRKTGHESIMKINLLVVTEISGSWRTSVIGVIRVGEVQTKKHGFCYGYRAVGRE